MEQQQQPFNTVVHTKLLVRAPASALEVRCGSMLDGWPFIQQLDSANARTSVRTGMSAGESCRSICSKGTLPSDGGSRDQPQSLIAVEAAGACTAASHTSSHSADDCGAGASSITAAVGSYTDLLGSGHSHHTFVNKPNSMGGGAALVWEEMLPLHLYRHLLGAAKLHPLSWSMSGSACRFDKQRNMIRNLETRLAKLHKGAVCALCA
eukprot:6184308-Pleurochrysis_carterae.AAC.6